MYFLVCTLKNCKTKRIFVSKKRASRSGGGAEPEATGHVDRHGRLERLALTVRSARSKIDKLAACCKFRSFEYRESNIDGPTEVWLQHKNVDRTLTWSWSWTYLDYSI